MRRYHVIHVYADSNSADCWARTRSRSPPNVLHFTSTNSCTIVREDRHTRVRNVHVYMYINTNVYQSTYSLCCLLLHPVSLVSSHRVDKSHSTVTDPCMCWLGTAGKKSSAARIYIHVHTCTYIVHVRISMLKIATCT